MTKALNIKMTASIDPWKLFRVILAVSALTLMVVRTGAQPMYDGCSMMHHE